MRATEEIHLTYCLNVHPGESWEEQFLAIREHAEPIARHLVGDQPFGLGLRLSAASAAHLAARPAELATFRDYLRDHHLYALTVNAFPFGRFHGVSVKDGVYRPDWTQRERLDYTVNVASVLAELLPEGVAGSLSTAPLTFKGWPHWERSVPAAMEGLAEAARRIDRLCQTSGRHIVLAIEPEPFCYPETTPELLEVFGRLPASVRALGTLGCCFDTAHQAVEFEDLATQLGALWRAEVPVGKIQLSAALAGPSDGAVRTQLQSFADPAYLHQTFRREGAAIRCMPDLGPALAEDGFWHPGGEVRVHYHVPLFVERLGALHSTAQLLTEPVFRTELDAGVTTTLEVETYTWNVWKDATGDAGSVDAGIIRELGWVRERLLS